MANGITGIDHVQINVPDLDRGVDYFRRLGFTVTPKFFETDDDGALSGLIFQSDHLEFRPPRVGAPLNRIVTGLLSPDLDQAEAALADRGFQGLERASVPRVLKNDSDLVFEVQKLLLPSDSIPDADLYLCQRPRLPQPRYEEWSRHANGARGLGVITVVVDDPESLCPCAERLFGESRTVLTDNTLAIFPGHSGFLFVTADHLSVMFPEFDLDYIETGRIAGMSILVDDIDHTAGVMKDGGVEFAWGPADRVIHVPASPDLDVLLEFTTRRRFGSISSYFG